MSSQMRPRETLMTVCDLCDEPITTDNHARKASLVHGYGGVATPEERARVGWWYLLWHPRDWPGGRAPRWEEGRWPENTYRHYDFHTECILKLVETAIAHRENQARAERGDVSA